MKKTVLFITLLVLFLGHFTVVGRADTVEDVTEKIRKQTGVQELENEAKERGIDTDEMLKPDAVLSFLVSTLKTALRSVLGAFAPLFAAGGVFFVFSHLCPKADENGVGRLVGLVAALVSFSFLLDGISDAVSRVGEMMDTQSGFTSALLSVLGATAAVGGLAQAATEGCALFAWQAGLFSAVLGAVVRPALTAYVFVGAAGVFLNSDGAKTISASVRNISVGFFSLFTFLFGGVMALRVSGTAQQDGLLMRAAYYGASSLLPVVGGSVARGLDTVSACASAVSHAAGTVGVVLFLCTALPCLLSLVSVLLCLSALRAVYAVAGVKPLDAFFSLSRDAVGVLLSVAVSYVMCTLSGTVVLMRLGS